MVNAEIIKNVKYGECVKLENGHAELIISLDFGPRIISYRLTDDRNILFEDPDKKIFQDDPLIKSYFDMGERWYMYGGHRLWVAPEIMPETYFPDDRTVEFELIENGVILRQMDQVKNGLRLCMKVVLDKESSLVQITHEITNIGKTEKELAPWSITGMAAGGVCIFEMPSLHQAFLPNRTLAIWPYTDMEDERLSIHKKYITLEQDAKKLKPCKIGTDNEAGYGVYLKDETLFIKRYEHKKEGRYPDRNVSFETYTNGFFLEMESLGELVTLMPGKTAVHEETWELKKAKGYIDLEEEASIDKFIIVNLGAGKSRAGKTGAAKK